MANTSERGRTSCTGGKLPAGFMRGMVIGLIIGFTSSLAADFGDRLLTPAWALTVVALGVGVILGIQVVRWYGRTGDEEKTTVT